uniref:Cell division cycle protein 27 homolog n=1 Tax=Petromyzon marinus TaxID=7757 RepID=S4RD56_PETMA
MTVLQEPVQAAIWHALNHYAFRDAVFLAERLFAEVASEEVLFLLATCYYRSGKPYKAYSLLKMHSCSTPQCKHLLARCCVELEKLAEAERILAGGILGKARTYEEITTEFGDAACFVLATLGQIYIKTERTTKGAECFQKSLGLNPFLWSQFEALCDIGEKPDPDQIFRLSSLQNFGTCQSNYPTPCGNAGSRVQETPVMETPQDTLELNRLNLESSVASRHAPLTPSASGSVIDVSVSSDSVGLLTGDRSLMSRPPRMRARGTWSMLTGSASPLTPSFGVLPMDTPSSADSSVLSGITPTSTMIETGPVSAPKKQTLTRLGQGVKPVFSQSGNSREVGTNALTQSSTPPSSTTQVLFPTSGAPANTFTNAPPRRSSRLFTSASSTAKENSKKPKLKFASPSKSLSRKPKSRSSKGGLVQPNLGENLDGTKPEPGQIAERLNPAQAVTLQKAAAEGLMSLLREMGKAYSALCSYNCKEAINLLSELPPHHYHTGWVLGQLGKAHYELAEYTQAEKIFLDLRHKDPTQLEGMETFSTTLWHLQRDVALSALAQDLTAVDKNSPQTWCTAGNCFSLQREHDVAIKFFQRAIQVDPSFAYAYTLLGHELALIEELEKSLACFRNAIRINPRHYNAWYGLGMIYFKQEKYSLAEVHFRKAFSINPQSSVLLCHIAVVQHALKKSDAALETLTRAINVEPKNPLCKFHRASILFANEKYKAALQELEELKQIVPKESLVYFLIGKVYKKLGQGHLALMNFSWAMDLDPKGANNQIKEAIDKRYLPDDDEQGQDSAMQDPMDFNENAEGFDSHESNMTDAEDTQLHAAESDES